MGVKHTRVNLWAAPGGPDHDLAISLWASDRYAPYLRLYEAVMRLPPPPCDGCPDRDGCEKECKAFKKYASKKTLGTGAGRSLHAVARRR